MTIETLRKAKKDTIRTLMRFGTSHPVLKYPMFITTVIFIFVYNVFLHTLIQVHVHEKLARVMAAVLSFAVFFTGMDLTVLAVQTAGEREQGETYIVTGFAALSEEVADQSVPVGTAVEELYLPETLAAYGMQNQEDSEDNAGNTGDDGTGIKPGDGDQEGTVSGNEGDGDNGGAEPGTGDGSGEGGADAGTEDGSGEGGADAGTGDGSGEGGADAGTEDGSGEGGADAGTGEGSSEGGDTGTGEGSSEGGGDTGTGEGSGEGGDAGAGEGSGEGGDAGTGEESGEGGGDAGTGEGSGEGGADAGTGDGGGDSGDAGAGSSESDSEAGAGAVSESVANEAADTADNSGANTVSTDGSTANDSAKNTATAWRVHTAAFVLPVYFSENPQDDVKAETLVNGGEAGAGAPEDDGNAGEAASEDKEPADEDLSQEIIIEDVAWESAPAYDCETEGVYVFTPVLPEGYALAEGVNLPQITVTVEEVQPLTAAGERLKEILRKYFDGIAEEGIYDAILSMDEDTRLSLTADYEELLSLMTEEDEADERLQNIVEQIGRGIADAAANIPIEAPVFFRLRAAAPAASGTIPLRRISGSGNAFVYHSFNETKTFTAGTTYAFLNGIYGYEDAVSSLGSGAILKATDENNNSLKYIRRKYGDSATVKVYVDVITKGKDFDHCEHGGLYQVPNSGTPTEYRYFCWAGGAQNCGPYYAYNYVKESLSYTDVSASLNDIEKQGSTDPKDYAVKVTFDGGRSMTLDAGSYTVQIPDSNSDRVNIIVSDSEGNQINTQFRMPLVVNYDGNGTGVSNVPSVQAAWKGESFTVSSTTPVRSGYGFLNWKEAQTGIAYTKGQRIASFGGASLLLKAQWKDIQAPEIGYTPTQVMTKTADAEVKAAVEAALTITDNEPVEECTVEITVPSNFTRTAGNKDVIVKVTDKAGNAITKTCTVSVMSYVEFSRPQFMADTKKLSVILRNPGIDPVTESGFVWGIMNAPSLTIHNGRKATTPTVAEADGTILVEADNLQKGVTYYARAYIIADGMAYYSDEIEIGIGRPAYGTFTIRNNNNNTFTVTRSGGSEGPQTVYYRTVNGSAVGGTHFSHQAGELTFAAGETSKTITVTEQGANTAYSGKPATAYTNADRTYSVEIYRVKGGGTLGDTTRAVRTMGKGSGYTIDRNIYTYKEETVLNSSGGAEWGRVTDAGYRTKGNPYFTVQMPTPNDYVKNTADARAFYLIMDIWEENDGNQWVKFVASDGSVSEWKFEIKPGSKGSSKRYNAHIPSSGPTAEDVKNFTLKENSGNMPFVAGEDYLSVPLGVQNVEVRFDASGDLEDDWRYENTRKKTRYVDTKEPKFVAVAPMAGGLYKAGDTFTVSLIFDEIVDSQNSGDLNGVKVNTTWGQASYAGGANTNVLYFTGTIAGNANQTLSVNGFTNPDRIKDMCDNTQTTATTSGGGSTTAKVDTAKPNITVTLQGIAGGTGTVKVVVNADQNKTNSLRYAWSDSPAAPATGWVDASADELSAAKGASGLPLSIRKDPGSGAGNGKWYLHAIGTYGTTGATDYKSAYVDFGTASAPAAGSEKPSLLVSTDNSAWAKQRTITIQRKGGGTLQYRKSGAGAWTTVPESKGSVTVTENGYYTFRLMAADNVLTQTISVEKIDRVNPMASVGKLLDSASTQSPKAGIYTKITLPVTFADSGSGVKTVQYQWTNTASTPGSWKTLSLTSSQLQAGKAELSYPATENTEATKYLHIKVTDQLDYVYTTKSSAAYKVISQSAVNNHTPKITLTGAPTKWTNDMATLTWTLSNYSGKNYEVILPDGRKARSNAANGEVWAPRNGTYTVKVRDLDYGGENTATVQVTKIDTTAPTVMPSPISGMWQKTAQTVSFTASDNSQSGVGKKYYKIVDTKDEIPTDGLTQLTSDSVNVTKDGVWYVYYKYYDQAGDDSIGREANKTEGFVGPVRIDRESPTAAVSMGGDKNEQSGWYTAAVPATLTFSDPTAAADGSGTPGGVSSVKYRWVNTETKPTSGLTALTTSQIRTGSHVDTQTGDGTWYLYYQVTDAAGNMTDGFSERIRLDKTTAALSVTGPAAGAEKRTGFTLNAQTGSFGVSGGILSVKKDGQETETTLKNSAGSGALSAGYSVTEPGTYSFYSRTNADKSDAAAVVQTRYVHQAVFDSRGGSEVEPQLVWTSRAAGDSGDGAGSGAGAAAECKVQKPADPEKRGLVFGGWYTDEKCKTAFDFDSQIYEDATLYAKWTADSYDVTYDLTNPDGSAYEAPDAYQAYTFGEGLTLPVPEQEGYQFSGWYLTADYTGDVQTVIGEDEIGAKTYYACYVDIAAPQIAAELSAESRESGWHTERPDIDLTYSDNQGVKRLLVSVDEGEWQELSGFPVGSAIKDDAEYTWAFTALLQGDHTYAFQAVDAIGLSTKTAPIRVKLDTAKPVIGELTYENKVVTLWQWIIGKKSMVIHVPVTDAGSDENAGSGVKKISYVMTSQAADGIPDADRAKTKTAAIEDGEAKIAFDEDFRGDVTIICTDVAGNDADIVTVSVPGIDGVIVEDNPPVILFRTPAANDKGWYKETFDINVAVTDDGQEDTAVTSGGLARIGWKEGEDGAEWTVEGLPGDSPVYKKEFPIPVTADGTHTYYVKAVDNAGNRSGGNAGEWESVTVKLDTTKPVIGEITYNEGYVNLWHWLIRRDSLIVNIPVTEEMSGLDKVTYTLTPGSMQSTEPVTKEAKIEKTETDTGTAYTAVIVIDPNYQGVIGNIQATDIAGNVSEPVTAYANGIGVIVEELKPVITVTADRLPTEEQTGTEPEGEPLSADYYQTAPELLVKVQDGSMTAAGIQEVKWRIGSGNEKTEDGGFGDALKTEYGFRIALSGLTGTLEVEITAVDNAGNSESKSVTVKIKGKEQTPEAEPDYPAEKLTGLKPGEAYLVRLPGGKKVSRKADENGEISIDNGWFGKEISLIKKGDGKNTKDSEPQSIALAARPAAPALQKNDETIKGKKDGQVTGVTDVMEISRDGKKTWEKAAGTVTDAASGKFWARVAATQTAPRGEEASVTIKEGRSLTVTFDSQGGSKVKPIKDLSWKETVKKPAEPKKEGDNGFCGWYREAAYENKWHFEEEPEADLMTDDVTLFAKWLPKTAVPMTAGISYRDETLTQLEPGAVYLIEGKEVTASTEGTVPIDESWFGKKINIVRRGDGTNTGDSDALRLDVPKRPAGPSKVQPKPESAQDAKDGKLTKTDTTMQYRRKGSTEWITITGEEITNLEPGDYELRYVSTDTAFSSKIVVKTVKKYSPPKKDDGGSAGGSHDGTTPGGGTNPEDGTKPGEGTNPEDGTKPGEGTNPEDGTEPGEGMNPEDGTKPGEGTNPEDGTKPGEGTNPEDGTKPGEGTNPEDGAKPGEGTNPKDGTIPRDGATPSTGTAPGHIVEDGRIVLEDSADGISGGMEQSTDGSGSLAVDHPYAVGKIVESLTIPVNQGAVIVTVNNMDKTRCTAQAADAVAVANAVLTQEHISRVSEGENIEIRIDVERIDDQVNSQDKELIEQGIEKAQEETSGLKVGMYVDISMFLRRGEGEWNAVHEIDEPIEIMIDMPEEFRELAADFYIVRAHAGECTLLPDLDDAAETITIETERFSIYAIAFRLTDTKAGRCGLCHICPTFLGICYFIWLILIAAAIVVIFILWYHKKDNADDEVM